MLLQGAAVYGTFFMGKSRAALMFTEGPDGNCIFSISEKDTGCSRGIYFVLAEKASKHGNVNR